ncbi:MAG: Nramp family divalent metal transporter [Pirellulales bacterium]|nr:Nramp family divalent metal transporter [Pirellulales bacterium]
MTARRLWNALGPGILLAATSVGASHLVLSPQAGAQFGYALLWLVVVAHLVKYPAFEFGPRYAAATGRSLLDGYARMPGPKHWALLVFLTGTLAQGIAVLAGVVSVAGCVLWTWTGALSTEWFSVALAAVILALLLVGGFSWLDLLNKVMMAVLALATVVAFVRIIPGPEALERLVVPSLPPGSIVLAAAILGWMPTGIDVSVWHSFWTIEKLRTTGQGGDASRAARLHRLRTALWDMRAGYGLSLCTGLMFVIMGAVHLQGFGAKLRDVEFVGALSTAYTALLGPWMYHVFMLTAFFAMFSTSYTVVDGFSRSFSECCAVLRPAMAAPPIRRRLYLGFVVASTLLACVILVRVGNPVTLATAGAMISLGVAPLLYVFNLYCVVRHLDDPVLRPSKLSVGIALVGIAGTLVALGASLYVKLLA